MNEQDTLLIDRALERRGYSGRELERMVMKMKLMTLFTMEVCNSDAEAITLHTVMSEVMSDVALMSNVPKARM